MSAEPVGSVLDQLLDAPCLPFTDFDYLKQMRQERAAKERKYRIEWMAFRARERLREATGVRHIGDTDAYYRKGITDRDAFSNLVAIYFDGEEPPSYYRPHVHRVRVRQYPDLTGEYGHIIASSKPGRGAFLVMMYDPCGDYRESWEDDD